jgi:hypothetical protein
MHIEDILSTLPSKEDLIKAIGIEARTSRGVNVATALGIFGTGVLIGAGLAILLAPQLNGELTEEEKSEPGETDEFMAPQAGVAGGVGA